MTFGIALGSNLGDRLQHLQEAVQRVLACVPGVQLLGAAPLYETAPVDCPEGSQPFFNTVLEISCALEPLELLAHLQAIERELGRPASRSHHAPRTVDLDILYADGVRLTHPELTLPHPRWQTRRFVLQPLADLRPSLIIPGQTQTVRELLAGLVTDEPALRLVQRDWLLRPNANL
ncbi:MAG: 2-amino-4-hydroxy-6-hydroxymethyldihydropteridine diphosphokinase [Roseimicrobium sp.]